MKKVKGYKIEPHADLRYANLQGADLRFADLQGANLHHADLRDADLRYANLRGANLHHADLRYADLRDADLRQANLRYANLRGADLRDANLYQADLDFSVWPLWCGTASKDIIVDKTLSAQLLYHACIIAQQHIEIPEKIKKFIKENFHRLDEVEVLE